MTPTATAPISSRVEVEETPQLGVKASKLDVNDKSVKHSSSPPIIDLYSGSQASVAITDEALRKDIISGLRGTQTYIIPGNVDSKEDRGFAFRRTLPTTILYSEKGLLLYDLLVEEPEYYLWRAEINILQKYAHEIAPRIFGHCTGDSSKLCKNFIKSKEETHEDRKQDHYEEMYPKSLDLLKEKWGDQRVGKHNGGVNAEEGLDGDRAVGCASLVELGAGSLRKTVHLIRALKDLPEEVAKSDALRTNVQYYALDLDKAELVRTLEELHEQEATAKDDKGQWTVLGGKVGINGMWATYDQGLEFIGKGGLSKTRGGDGKRCLMWLGSSIGNFNRRGAAEFLQVAAQSALRPGDTMLISVDRRNKAEDVAKAYNDARGRTRDFILQGINHADKILGGQGVLDPSRFEYYDRYNAVEGRHESYYRSLRHQILTIPGESEPIEIEEGELIHVESSYKYNEREALDIFDFAGLRVLNRWTDDEDRYDVWLVERPPFHFTSSRLMTGSRQDIGAGLSVAEANEMRGSWEFDSDGGAGSNAMKEPTVQVSWGLPSLADWEELWKAWNTVTLTMIPDAMLHDKPIDLRHICLFYIGHIPAFLDIMLARNLKEPHTNPHFSEIFERGIDPHMDDETQCNPHSEVPIEKEDWPTLRELIEYQGKVVQRVKDIYADLESGKRILDRRTARLLWMTLEHKGLHLETLLYMLVQSESTLPPSGFIAPDWAVLSSQWDAMDAKLGGQAAREEVLNFKPGMVILGHDDDDSQDFDFVASKASGNVNDLNAQLGKPEFGWDNEQPERHVKTEAFSITAAPISNKQYLEFLSSTDSKDYPSSWAVGDVGDPLIKTVYGPVDMRVAHLWPVQASGVQLTKYAAWKGGRLPTHAELRRFLDATSGPNVTDRPGSNIGFRNWHPVPSQIARPDHDGSILAGHNGGVWEWTSSTFDSFEGFRNSALYPGYSSDFFDGKHSVVLGGSWATTPAVAGRRTVVNSYQTSYPYTFASARVVFDKGTTVKARGASPSRD
ncbi:hypothetical protein CBS101457_006323 [Exobasidium rhododendri]|nr:hypothetical protein CBS101457_006323 [Exobasidium rhododendri]